MTANDVRIDALLPSEMARRAEYLGERKARMPFLQMFTLAILAGAFIALGAVFSTTASASPTPGLPYGVTRVLSGLVFSVGLILVVVGGAELFTGNTLIVMAWASKKVTSAQLLRNWVIVYLGNFVGAVGTAVMVFLSRQYTFGENSVGITALKIASSKVHLGFIQAIFLGILCNVLVCLAIWLTYSARSTLDKIAAIVFPITAFVAAGFEHSIANMYFIPIGLLINDLDPQFIQAISSAGINLDGLSWGTFLLNNLLPVTIGNLIGGAVLVAAVYWSVFLRQRD